MIGARGRRAAASAGRARRFGMVSGSGLGSPLGDTLGNALGIVLGTAVSLAVVGSAGAVLAQGAASAAVADALPASTIAVRTGHGWATWWNAQRPPARWRGPDPIVVGALHWRLVRPGIEQAELDLAGNGEAWRIRAVVLRADPRALRFRLDAPPGGRAAWAVDDLGDDAVLACNAGQFTAHAPWGWVVRDGREVAPPGHGPLAPAVVVDADGVLRLVAPDSIAAVRTTGRALTAFQSYPALLVGEGEVPDALRAAGHGVDVGHRDSRLALGVLPDGRLLLVLTRFQALGGVLAPLPVGLTVPETAALLGALGSRRAVALDGGASGQLLVRERAGSAQLWPAWRRVPLGFVAEARDGWTGLASRGARAR